MSSEPLDAVVDTVDDLLASSRDLLVAVNDPDRATPTRRVLEQLLERHPHVRLTALVATGTHHFDADRRRAHERRHALDRCAHVYWHDARSASATETLLARPVPLLAIGSVEPHWFAGWTGAHKTLTVGLWPRARIEANHALALSPDAGPCQLDDNPVAADLLAALDDLVASRLAPTRAINLVLDDAHDIEVAAAGTPQDSLRAVLPAALARFVDTIEAPLDRLVARVGPPLDGSLYQALKGITNHAAAVRDGGALVLVAPCPDGVGIDHFVDLLRQGPEHATVERLIAARGYCLGDHKALRQRELTDLRGLQLALVGAAVAPAIARTCGFVHMFHTEDEALAWARNAAPGQAERIVDDAGQRVTRVRRTTPHKNEELP